MYLHALALIALLPLSGVHDLRTACAAPENREFDFWLGDWDAYDVGEQGPPSARVQVASLLGGCALEETYAGANGVAGRSFTIYDVSRRVWHQTWVTNRGDLLTIEGGRLGDRIVLEGGRRGKDGQTERVRGTWMPAAGAVREWAETSRDDGRTWTKWFDIVFRSHASTTVGR